VWLTSKGAPEVDDIISDSSLSFSFSPWRNPRLDTNLPCKKSFGVKISGSDVLGLSASESKKVLRQLLQYKYAHNK
jgi:hypothetical protein